MGRDTAGHDAVRPPTARRRVVAGAAILAAVFTAASGVGAESAVPTRPVSADDSDGRFREVSLPSSTRVTGRFDDVRTTDGSLRVIVVLDGDSVASASRRARRVGAGFDAAASRRLVDAEQRRVLAAAPVASMTVHQRYTDTLNAVSATVRVADLDALAAAPGIVAVHVVRTYRHTNGAADAYTNVPTAWERFTPPWGDTTGDGVVIGVIDDGIDYHHADFGGSGDPADYDADDPTVIETTPTVSFPTDKVIGGYDFSGDQYDANAEFAIACASLTPADVTSVPCPDPDPLACGVHGTHVAGTAAGQGVLADGSTFDGPYGATTLDDHDFLVAPGSAPQASLVAYKVFGCDGSVGDDVLLAAIEQAIDDDVDVLNLSLGSDFGVPDGPLETALDGATALGVTVVVSAGNSGAGAYLVGGPGTADTVVSVAAADASAPQLPSVTVTPAGSAAIDGQNSNLHVYSSPVIGEAVYVGTGCYASDFADAAGKIALTDRGECDRVLKAELGQSEGAIAVLMANDDVGYPPVEGPITGVTIPFVGVTPDGAQSIEPGVVLTLTDGGTMANPVYGGFASFTSAGPRSDNALKPDVTAPGVDIVSAGVGTGTAGLTLSGTSMASPHVAGIAALVRQTHPAWSPAQVKGALMGTATPMENLVTGQVDVVRGGAGMVDAARSTDSVATVTTSDGMSNLSFGFRELTGPFESTLQFQIHNDSAAGVTYDLAAVVPEPISGVTVSFSADPITVAASSSATVSVTIAVADPAELPSAEINQDGELWPIQGFVRATPTSAPADGVHQLVVPFLLVAHGLSDVRSTGGMLRPSRAESAPFIPDVLRLTNDGPHDATYDVYQWALSDDVDDVADDTVPDIAEVGAQLYDDPDLADAAQGDVVVFAINTANRVTTQSLMEYDIWLDLDGDSTFEYVVVVIDAGLALDGYFNGSMISLLLDATDFSFVSALTAFAPSNGSIIEAPVRWADIGFAQFDFDVVSYSLVTDEFDYVGVAHYDPGAPAVGNGTYASILDTELVNVTAGYSHWNSELQESLGWLVVSVDNASGAAEAGTVPLLSPAPVRP